MKKTKGLISLAIVAILCGCSCGRVNETTYNNAINNFNSTDAISFTRIENVTSKADPSSYSRTIIDAKFIFDGNKNGDIVEAEYKISDYVLSTKVSSNDYYYVDVTNTLYSKKQIPGVLEERIKESTSYEDYFNIHNCSTTSCRVGIQTNLAPIFSIDDVHGFVIEKIDGEAVATFSAACPAFENCKGNEMLDYKLIIGGDGNVLSLYYTIDGKNDTTTISYKFNNYGSNDVTISFPNDLDSYIDGNID